MKLAHDINDKSKFLASIIRAFNVSEKAVTVESVDRAVVLVTPAWLQQLLKCGSSERTLHLQNETSLSTPASDCIKLLVYHDKHEQEALRKDIISTNNDFDSFGSLLGLIAYQRHLFNWKLSYQLFPENYNCEYFESNSAQSKTASFLPATESVEGRINVADCRMHFNLFPVFADVLIDGKKYQVKRCVSHSVYDTLMYSPYRLANSSTRQLFILYQLIKAFHFVQLNFPQTKLTNVLWKSVALNELLWIQVNVSLILNEDAAFSTTSNKESKHFITHDDSFLLKDLVDLWVNILLNTDKLQ